MNEILVNSSYFGIILCLFFYQIAILIKKKFKFAIFNPLSLSIIAIIVVLLSFDIPYDNFMQSANLINYFLVPVTACLALPLYEQIELLKQNFFAIAIGIISGMMAGLISILVLSAIFGINHELYISLLPKSVTTPIAMSISDELGGVVTITVSVVVITGIFGAMIGEWIFKIFSIKNPIAQGTALGSTSHAVGTAKAIELGDIQAGMSSLAIAITGIFTLFWAYIFSYFL